MAFQFKPAFIALASVILGWASCCLGQTPPLPPAPDPAASASAQLPGNINGTVVDQSGAVVAGARVKLTAADQSQEVVSGGDGQFSFANIAPGPFQLTITATGFAPQTANAVLAPGETSLPQVALGVATNVSEVQVSLTQTEVAEQEIKVEEKQRVLGAIPNFYVSYVPDAVPLNSKQKFKLAWKTVIDPFTLVVVAGAAGVEQTQNHFAGYGQGAQGYAKRLGAGYADTVAGTFIGSAILPSLLKQDPRYFYKGTGGMGSRFAYAIANALICKGDNGHWQVNYSNILGSLAAGGISNLYYPAQDRNGAGLTFENGAIGIGVTAVDNLFQEFVVRKLTPKIPRRDPAKP
jgi:Carboxypeptidase regulatory-like domain